MRVCARVCVCTLFTTMIKREPKEKPPKRKADLASQATCLLSLQVQTWSFPLAPFARRSPCSLATRRELGLESFVQGFTSASGDVFDWLFFNAMCSLIQVIFLSKSIQVCLQNCMCAHPFNAECVLLAVAPYSNPYFLTVCILFNSVLYALCKMSCFLIADVIEVVSILACSVS